MNKFSARKNLNSVARADIIANYRVRASEREKKKVKCFGGWTEKSVEMIYSVLFSFHFLSFAEANLYIHPLHVLNPLIL
jgi:hypothetical protein